MSRGRGVRKRLLWEAGCRVCVICNHDVPHPIEVQKGDARASFEHVIPRSPRSLRKERLEIFRRIVNPGVDVGGLPTVAISHHRCNQDRGNAPPTGCMIVFLAAVNLRLYGPKPRKRYQTLATAERCVY